MSDAAGIVDALTARLEPLETAANQAWWDTNTSSDPAADTRRAEADLALSDALAESDAYADVIRARAALKSDPDVGPAPDHVGRQLALLADALAPHQLEAELRRQIVDLQVAVEGTFARHRGELDGAPVDDNAIIAILRTSTDVEQRRAAWEASKTVGAVVAPEVRELARLRNAAAQSVGYRDFFSMSLATTEFAEARLFATLEEVDRLTSRPHAAWKAVLDARLAKRFGCSTSELRPWHYDDPFFQEPPTAAAVDLTPMLDDADLAALTVRTYEGLGLDVGSIVDRSDLLPRDGKNQHAFCIDVNRAGDVRVLANVVANEQWTSTLLHEFGHGVYFAEVSRDLPWLLRTMHMLTTEGIAMLGGRFVRDPDWLRTVAGVPAADVRELAPALREAQRSALLVFARWVLVMTNFERALYADPDSDLDTLWWDLVQRYQRLTKPAGRNAPDWAAKIHVAVAPVYYQNYLYGELFASQLEGALRAEFGGIIDREGVGALLVDRVFRPGAELRWDALVEHATGAPLSGTAFAADLAG